MAQHLLQDMRIHFAIVLCYFDAGFEPHCFRKEYLAARLQLLVLLLLLVLLKCVAHCGP